MLFCGAGVSAKAGLPGAWKLIEILVNKLGSADNSIAREELDQNSSFDFVRAFSALVKEFPDEALYPEVAKALKPTDNPNLNGHKNLLRLAQTPENTLQLITTNFDRLFEQAYSELYGHAIDPTKILKPQIEAKDPDGIAYLHGCVKDDYSDKETTLVAAKNSFGQAYMVQGWAAKFFQYVVKNYTVLFIGYSAEDMPVDYMLSSLNEEDKQNKIYSFAPYQNEAQRRQNESIWQDRGVESISYDVSTMHGKKQDHSLLWNCLEDWANFGASEDAFNASMRELAKQDPKVLLPFQRRQVLYWVLTLKGAKIFANITTPAPSAEWLCVFDKNIRENNAEYAIDEESKVYDLFECDANNQKQLSPHLNTLKDWLLQKSNDPFLPWLLALDIQNSHFKQILVQAIYNIVSQENRYYNIYDRLNTYLNIRQEILVADEKFTSYKFSLSKANEQSIREYGLEFSAYIAPKTAIVPSLDRLHLSGQSIYTPPENIEDKPVAFEVSYIIDNFDSTLMNCQKQQNTFPIQHQDVLVKSLLQGLNTAIQLEKQWGHFSPLMRGLNLYREDISQPIPSLTEGLIFLIYHYAHHFNKLHETNSKAAQDEYANWPKRDQEANNRLAAGLTDSSKRLSCLETEVFFRLRLWAAQFPELMDNQAFMDFITNLDNTIFWQLDYQADLLWLLKARWTGLEPEQQQKLEKLLLQGLSRPQQDEKQYYFPIIQRLKWLEKQNCTLSQSTQQKLTEFTRKWHSLTGKTWADRATDEATKKIGEIFSGQITSNKDSSKLENLPLKDIVPKALEVMQHSTFFKRNKPFSGLTERRPLCAFLALIQKIETNNAVEDNEKYWELWRQFFSGLKEQGSHYASLSIMKKSVFICSIITWIYWLPDSTFLNILKVGHSWFQKAINTYFAHINLRPVDYEYFLDKLIDKAINALKSNPNTGSSYHNYNWFSDPNYWHNIVEQSPVSLITNVLLNDQIFQNQTPPLPISTNGLQKLLWLSGNNRIYSVYSIFQHFNKIYNKIPHWVEDHLLPILNRGSQDEQFAAWQGYLDYHTNNLNFRPLPLMLKQNLVDYITSTKPLQTSQKSQYYLLARILLKNWFDGKKSNTKTTAHSIENEDLHTIILKTDDEFRRQLLEYYAKNYNERIDLLPEFIKEVWPKQRSVRSDETTLDLTRLVLRALDNTHSFKYSVESVLLLLEKKVVGDILSLSGITSNFHDDKCKADIDVIDPLLKLLDKVLAQKINNPLKYDLSRLLVAMEKMQPSIKDDARWQRLYKIAVG